LRSRVLEPPDLHVAGIGVERDFKRALLEDTDALMASANSQVGLCGFSMR
jgi:hypothetical protein